MAKKNSKEEKLNYSAELRRLKDFGPERLYLLRGPEDYLREQYLGQLKKICLPEGEDSFSYKRINGPELDMHELRMAVDAMPFMTERSFVDNFWTSWLRSAAAVSPLNGRSALSSWPAGRCRCGGKAASLPPSASPHRCFAAPQTKKHWYAAACGTPGRSWSSWPGPGDSLCWSKCEQSRHFSH